MEKIINTKTKLKKVQNKLVKMNSDYDELQDELDNINWKMESLEEEIEILEREENTLLNQIRNYIHNGINESTYIRDGFEEKVLKATLFTGKKGQRKDLSYVYVDKESIYAIDGYRALEYKHRNDDINKAMFVEIDMLLEQKIDISLFNEINVNVDDVGLGIAKKIIKNEFDKTTGDIFNIDSDYFMHEFLYKEKNSGAYDLLIFDFSDLKIAVRKEFIEDMLAIFRNKKFNVGYSENTQPLFFYDDEIKIIILPVRCSYIDKI